MSLLPPEKFVYEKHICTGFDRIHEMWDFKNDRPQKGFTEIGRCSALNISFRARKKGEVVMLEDNETFEQFWFHIR